MHVERIDFTKGDHDRNTLNSLEAPKCLSVYVYQSRSYFIIFRNYETRIFYDLLSTVTNSFNNIASYREIQNSSGYHEKDSNSI